MRNGFITLNLCQAAQLNYSNVFFVCCFTGICNASVIFGIGKQKYRTEHVRDNDPTWNEETVM